MDELNHLGWVVQRSFEVGHYRFSVRSNSAAVGEWLDVLAPYESDEEVGEAYYSIWLGETAGTTRGLHIFYREAQVCLRTFDLTAIARLFFSELETLMLEDEDSALHLKVGVLGRNGVTALVPSTLIHFLRDSGPGAEREFELPLSSYVSVDPDHPKLLPDRRHLQLPDDAALRLARLDPEHAGSYQPVSTNGVGIACAFEDMGGIPIMPVTRARLTYALLQAAINLRVVRGDGVRALADLLAGMDCVGLRPDPPREMMRTLRDLTAARAADGHL